MNFGAVFVHQALQVKPADFVDCLDGILGVQIGVEVFEFLDEAPDFLEDRVEVP